ncbi:hypothetical protein [Sphingomonas sp. CARO-RG-8B-R24-01]|uniref:hypothetical protein n=1 Tax=Sphingomonas sp. CARO-RG-8B-R24-01 TaxID=2914831 RepID=UPI001F55AFA1|nr:hypothetical protein [Sphingomonas sp. CARO-RG-8B-R24-01]
MRSADRTTIALAVQILRDAVEASRREKVDTVPVRLALRVLLPHCPERWPLTNLWEAAGYDEPIGRAQNVSGAFNGILVQLAKSGAWRN